VSDEHLKFHKVVHRHYSCEVEMFIWFCRKFIPETMH